MSKKGLLLFYLDLESVGVKHHGYQKTQKANFLPQHEKSLSKNYIADACMATLS